MPPVSIPERNMSYIQRHDTAGSTQPIVSCRSFIYALILLTYDSWKNPYDQRGTSPTQGYTEPRYNQTQPAPVQAMTSDIPVDEIAKLFKRKDPSELQMDANGQRGWSENIFDCFNDLGTFCMAYWCPCIVYGQVKQRINYLEHTGRPDPDRGGNGIGNDCLYHGALNMCCGLGSLLQASYNISHIYFWQ